MFKNSILVVLVLILFFEAHHNIESSEAKINNYFTRLTDVNNTLEENAWLNTFEFNNYQAILPLPFFHIGSENYLIVPENSAIKKETFLLSLKSGLPTVAMSGSRTSRSQSIKIFELFLEHYQTPRYLNDLNSSKPFLIIHKTSEFLTKSEALILTRAKLISTYNDYKLYGINPKQLDFSEERYMSYQSIIDSIKTTVDIDSTSWKSKNNTFNLYVNYNEKDNKEGINNSAAFVVKPRQYNLFYQNSLPDSILDWKLSFWLKHYDKDVYPRTGVYIVVKTDTETIESYHGVNNYCKQIYNNWALIEMDLTFKALNKLNEISLYIYNFELYNKNDMLVLDDLLISPSGKDFFQFGGEFPRMNNRFILKP